MRTHNICRGIPFDQGTTYRSGARFGVRAVRAVSGSVFGFNYLWNTDGFSLDQACPNIIDYGDVGAFYGKRATEVMMEESYKHAKRILDQIIYANQVRKLGAAAHVAQGLMCLMAKNRIGCEKSKSVDVRNREI